MLEHADGVHCCAMGESWDLARDACVCTVDAGCGPGRCPAATVAPAACAATTTTTPWPSRNWYPYVHLAACRSREHGAALNELRVLGGVLPHPLNEAPHPALLRPRARVGSVELTCLEEQLFELEESLAEARRAHDDARQRHLQSQHDAKVAGIARVRSLLITLFQEIVATVPESSELDQTLHDLALTLVEAGRAPEALQILATLLQRFPRSPYAASAQLAFGDLSFDRDDMGAATASYEGALQVEGATSHARAYAHYRLGWVRARAGDLVGATRRFADAARLARELPTPRPVDLGRMIARDAPALYAARPSTAPARAISAMRGVAADEREASEMLERLADGYRDRGQWSGALVTYRHLMTNASLHEHFCRWRAGAERAMTCAHPTAP